MVTGDVDATIQVAWTLMVLGFVGTVICLERAVALGHRLAYLVPAMSGFGVIVLLAPLPSTPPAPGLLCSLLPNWGC
ncbi:hypothetical protein JCM18916_3838 [Cutibacterium acnes JCM 18916]|nr:hypothetical protein JCM18916_3838 [Cutibacterium acnes JCM 18916]